MKAFSVSSYEHSAPHIHSGVSVSSLTWKKIAALFPLVFVSLWIHKGNALLIYAAVLAGGLLADAAGKIISGRNVSYRNGSTILTALTLALLLPVTTLPWAAALTSFLAIFFGQEIFGGLGQAFFYPALLGALFLKLSFPETNTNAIAECGNLGLFAILSGCLLLAGLKLVRWQVSILFLALLAIFTFLFQWNPADIFTPGCLLLAFWVLTDSLTAPLTWGAHILQVICAALFSVLLIKSGMNAIEAILIVLLFLSAFTPWTDEIFMPKGKRK